MHPRSFVHAARWAVSSLLAVTLLAGCPDQRETEASPTATEELGRSKQQGHLENSIALHRTFEKLRKLEKRSEGRVAMMQLGASHTASMAFGDETSKLFAARFGERGPGFFPAAPMKATFLGAPPMPDSERGRIRIRSQGPWETETALYAQAGGVWSLAGNRLRGKKGASLEVEFEEPRCDVITDAGCEEKLPPDEPGALDVFYVDEPGSGRISLLIDGEERALPKSRFASSPSGPTLASTTSNSVQVARLDLPHPPKRIEMKVSGPGKATVHGFAYERSGAGVVYDTLGLSGSSAYVTDRWQKPTFVRQLKSRDPSLYILFYGTNESTFAELTAENYRKRYSSLIKTLRQAAPGSDCLLLSNTDREVPKSGAWVPAPRGQVVEDTIRAVALENGCAYWSTRKAMGGPGGVKDWMTREPPLALPDHTHLTDLGYRTLAQMLVGDLLAAYDASMLPELR